MFDLFKKSFDSLKHKEIWRYLLLSFLLAFLAFYGLFEVVAGVVNDTQFFENKWLERVADFFAKAGTLILSWLLFPAFMLIIASIFEEKIAEIVEEKEYKKILNPTPLSISEEAKLIVRNLLWNIAFIPVYIIPMVNILVYYALNSYLVGNTIFRFIAARKHGSEKAKLLAAQNNTKIVGAGLGIVLLTSLPIANMIAPVFAIILMVHLTNGLKQG